MDITPADVEEWILGMYDEDKDIKEMPITKYIINQLVVPKAQEELDSIVANATFVELVPGDISEGDAGQDPMYALDGFLTIINADKAGASNMNHFDPSTDIPGFTEITSSNILTVIEAFVDQIDTKYKRKNMPIYIDPTLYRMYKRKYKSTYGSDSGDPQFGSDVVDFTKSRLIPLESMNGSKSFFSTPKENFIGLRHKNEPGATSINIVKFSAYTASLIGEFRFGVGFAIAEGVFAYTEDADSGSGYV
jgi:hypothetical protein